MFKINRKLTAYKIVGKTFGAWLAPLITGFLLFLMIRRPPRSTQGVSSAASDVYKRQLVVSAEE